MCSSIGKSYLVSFVHIVKGDDVVEESISDKSEDEVLDIDEKEELPIIDDSTRPSQEILLDEKNSSREVDKDKNDMPEEVPLEEGNEQPTSPVTFESDTRGGGTRYATAITAVVNVVNNTSSTIVPKLNATSFSFVHTNDDGSRIINIDETCSADSMSCSEEIDLTSTGSGHFFNLEHNEYLDYYTTGFSCIDDTSSPVALPVSATSFGSPLVCTITYEYVDPKITVDGVSPYAVSILFGDTSYGSGVNGGLWHVTYLDATLSTYSPDTPCLPISGNPFVSKCYDFIGKCSGETFDLTIDKLCSIYDMGSFANIPVNSYLVKKYPPQNDNDYLDATDSSLVPTFYIDTESNLLPYHENTVLGDVNTTKRHIVSTIQVYENSGGYSVYATPINIKDTNPIGYEYLGCRERPNNNLSNELNFANATSVNSEIDCFYKVLPIQLTISKSNNSLLDGINAGDTIDYTIEVKAPDDSLPGTYLSNQTTLFDKLPTGITYQPGTFVATSSRRGNLPLSEPAYSGDDWATWDLGDIQEGEVVTLTYKAKISTSTLPGTYTDQSYVKGMSLTDEEVLGVGANGTEFVSSNILVVTATANPTNNQNTPTEVETSSENIKKLPNTGVTIYLSIFGMFSILIGITLLKINRNNLIN